MPELRLLHNTADPAAYVSQAIRHVYVTCREKRESRRTGMLVLLSGLLDYLSIILVATQCRREHETSARRLVHRDGALEGRFKKILVMT